ncbi:endogenous retrovirus group K member 7 Gag polyprotein-like [Marmota monax]|uniref:endogenous retrovirus group K member 7 Gag polyprotein-like n=1 Tax=Marmota monax TaxID=9995 RepID=UPI0026F14CB1|nr:endogenous retrovirus group K member 7 Gag polyprotein-like [Marmota monax]
MKERALHFIAAALCTFASTFAFCFLCFLCCCVMGAASSSPLLLALDGLLRSKGLEVKHSTLQRFLQKIDIAAPWFAFSGSLTVPSWDKLGKDLDFASEQGILEGGVIPLWKMVRGCLTDGKCQEAVREGQAILEQLHEEKSEGSCSEVAESIKSNSSEKAKEPEDKNRRRLYPDLTELKMPENTSDSESSEDLDILLQQLHKIKMKKKKKETQGTQAYCKKGKGVNIGQQNSEEEEVEYLEEDMVPIAPPPYVGGAKVPGDLFMHKFGGQLIQIWDLHTLYFRTITGEDIMSL